MEWYKDKKYVVITEKKEAFCQKIKGLFDIRYISSTELEKDVFGYFDEEAIIRYAVSHNESLETSRIILKWSLLLDPQGLKEKYKDFFHKSIKQIYEGCIVYIDSEAIDVFYLAAINELKSFCSIIDEVKEVNEEVDFYRNMSDEVEDVARKITQTKKKVYLYPTNEDYYPYIFEYFTFYKIPYSLSSGTVLASLPIAREFLKRFVEKESLYESIKEAIEPLKGFDFYENMLRCLSSFSPLNITYKEALPLIKESLLLTSVQFPILDNSVIIGDVFKNSPNEDDDVFILGVNQGAFPLVHRDDDFLSDEKKAQNGIPTSLDLNTREKKAIYRLISKGNVHLSSSAFSFFSEYQPSRMFKAIESKQEDAYSQKSLQLHLAEALDLFYKYGIEDEKLPKLLSKKKNLYGSFRHENNFHPLIDIKQISFTKIQKYNHCAFLYYLEDVLKVKRYPKRNYIEVGTVIHKCLELDSEKPIDEYLDETMTKKEAFYFNIYRKYLRYASKKRDTLFTKKAVEEKFSLDIDGVELVGVVDKLMEYDGKYLILDYKTGTLHDSLGLLPFGIDMQLPIYFLLVSKLGPVSGGYLVPVLPNKPFNYEKGKTYDEQVEDFFKLVGYSCFEDLEAIDLNYKEKSFLKGIRVKTSGELYSASTLRVFDPKLLEKLNKYTEGIIKETIGKIQNGIYPIDPKVIDKNSVCGYCLYQDICFRKSSDLETIVEDKEQAFIRGEENE